MVIAAFVLTSCKNAEEAVEEKITASKEDMAQEVERLVSAIDDDDMSGSSSSSSDDEDELVDDDSSEDTDELQCRNKIIYKVAKDENRDGKPDTRGTRVRPFRGDLKGGENYSYCSLDADPKNGPSPEPNKSKSYLYRGKDGLSLGFFHFGNTDEDAAWKHLDLDIYTYGNYRRDDVLFVDDDVDELYIDRRVREGVLSHLSLIHI